MRSNLIRVPALLLLLLPLLGSSCPRQDTGSDPAGLLTPFPAYGAAPILRVKLSAPTKASAIEVDAGRAVLMLGRERREVEGRLLISSHGGQVHVSGHGSADQIEIQPMERPRHFSVAGQTYRGRLRVQATPAGWNVINIVDMEQYIAGVIGWEMLANWPVESLKAQAVASRTYALFTMRERRDSGETWHLDDTTRYQVYGGVGPTDKPEQWRETPNVLAARKATTGQVLTYRGQGFKAFFHSTSGGHSTDFATAFGGAGELEPLSGADLGDFGKASPKHRWSVSIERSELADRLKSGGAPVTDPISIKVATRAESGHAIELTLYDRNGQPHRIQAVRLRRMLKLPSTNFIAGREGTSWVFKGRGYGHGCGLCQWSAAGMARKGWGHERILLTMYPGSKLKTLW